MSAPLAQQYNSLLNQRNRLMCAALLLCSLSLVLGCITWTLTGKERTIVLPAELHRPFWITDQAMSDSYLEQIAQFLVHVLLNVTPTTFAQSQEQFLSYVAPQYFSAMRTQLVAQQLEIERLGMSSIFYPRQFKVNAQKKFVEVEGALKISLGNSPLESQTKSYRLTFLQEQGRLWLRSFEELKHEP